MEDKILTTDLPESNPKTDLIDESLSVEPVSNDDKKSFKINKKIAFIIAAFLIIIVAGFFSKSILVAATVDGQPVSRLTLINRLEKAGGKDVLEALIIEKLISNEAKKQNISVSDEDVNAEVQKIADQLTAQGNTIEQILSEQGLNMDDLKKQILLQKELEKILADKVTVSDDEVAKYISDNKIAPEQGQENIDNEQIRNQLVAQKMNIEAPTLIETLKAKAKIKCFISF